MAQRLSVLQPKWTQGPDTVSWPAFGFGVINNTPTNTQNGGDSILINGLLSNEPGLQNDKPLKFGSGNNLIDIQLDTASGSEQPGLLNQSTITSAGNLAIRINNTISVSGLSGDGIVNLGTIAISGSSRTLSITVLSQGESSIVNGGTAAVTGDLTSPVPIGRIKGGALADRISVNQAIDNYTGSRIDLLGGDDSIIAGGLIGHGDITLKNAAKDILTGAGNDNVDVSSSFAPDSELGLSSVCIDLGSGNDTIRAYGTARLNGGTGVDTLLLPIGLYQVMSTDVKGVFLISDTKTSLYTIGFEQIGSFDGTLSPFPIGTSVGLLTLA